MSRIPVTRDEAIALATRMLDRAFGPTVPQLDVIDLVDALIVAAQAGQTPRQLARLIRGGGN